MCALWGRVSLSPEWVSEGVALGDTQKGNQNKGNVSLAEALVVELKVEVGLVKLKKSDVRIDRCQRKIVLPGVLLHNHPLLHWHNLYRPA